MENLLIIIWLFLFKLLKEVSLLDNKRFLDFSSC